MGAGSLEHRRAAQAAHNTRTVWLSATSRLPATMSRRRCSPPLLVHSRVQRPFQTARRVLQLNWSGFEDHVQCVGIVI